MIRLEADDPQVRARTVAAVRASLPPDGIEPTLTIRCRQCGAQLAQAGATPHGFLFTSTWAVPRSPAHEANQGAARWYLSVNGVDLHGRQAREAYDRIMPVTAQSGPPIDAPEFHGVIALLNLPDSLPADYPHLLVRCVDHGDAVLDRSEVLISLRESRPLKTSVSFPRIEYRPPDPAFTASLGVPRRSHEERRMGGAASSSD